MSLLLLFGLPPSIPVTPLAEWPASLPELPQLPVTLGFEDGVIRTQNDVGPAQTRRASTVQRPPMSFRLPMNRAEFNVFRTFWATIQGRLLPFEHHWPMTKETRRMRFTALPQARALGADYWDVELEVEVLPLTGPTFDFTTLTIDSTQQTMDSR